VHLGSISCLHIFKIDTDSVWLRGNKCHFLFTLKLGGSIMYPLLFHQISMTSTTLQQTKMVGIPASYEQQKPVGIPAKYTSLYYNGYDVNSMVDKSAIDNNDENGQNVEY